MGRGTCVARDETHKGKILRHLNEETRQPRKSVNGDGDRGVCVTSECVDRLAILAKGDREKEPEIEKSIGLQEMRISM